MTTRTKIVEAVCNAEEQRAALARMFDIEQALPKATPEEAKALQAEYDALDGSWLHDEEMWIDLMSPAEAQAFTAAEQAKETNARTVEDQAAAALAVNKQIVADGNAWLAANTGTLSAAQLSAAMRQTVQASVKAAQQRNGLIRLLLRRFEGTD